MQRETRFLVSGGTGFYIQAVTRDIDFTEARQENTYRMNFKAGEEKGAELSSRVPSRSQSGERRESGHANNIKHVIQALEFYHQNGTPISEHQ